jgi:vacuolar-type H+-ATPase subunit E/Vma4
LESKAKEMLSELDTDRLFEKKRIYKNVDDTGYFSIAVLIENFLFLKKCEITIEIVMDYGYNNSFIICIRDRKQKYDSDFHKIIKEILPDFDKNYEKDEDGSVRYGHDLNEYDIALDRVKEIINCFKNYKKRKHGT